MLFLLLATTALASPTEVERCAELLRNTLAAHSGHYAGAGYNGQIQLTPLDSRSRLIDGAWRVEVDVRALASGSATVTQLGRSLSCATTVKPTVLTVSAEVVVAANGRPLQVRSVDADLSALTAERIETCLPSDTFDKALLTLLHTQLEPHRETWRRALQQMLRRAIR